ncbi:hypothetical protein CPC16_002860, partial [Podila verticillata]
PLVSGGAEVTSTQEAASPEPNANNAKFRQPMPQSQPPAQFSGFRPQFIPGNFSARGRGRGFHHGHHPHFAHRGGHHFGGAFHPNHPSQQHHHHHQQQQQLQSQSQPQPQQINGAQQDAPASISGSRRYLENRQEEPMKAKEYNETEGEEYYGDGQEGYGGEMDGYYYDQPLYYYYYPPDVSGAHSQGMPVPVPMPMGMPVHMSMPGQPFMPPMYYDGSVPISAPMPGHSMPMAHPNGEMMMMMPPPPPPGTGPSPDDYNNYYYYQPPVYFSPHPHPPVPAPSTPVQRS